MPSSPNHAAELVGEDATRPDAVDADIVLAAATGEVDDEAFHRGLRGLIGRRRRAPILAN